MLYNLCKDDNIFGLMFWGQDGWTKNIKEVLIMDKKQSANKLHNAINAKPCNGGFFYVNQITEGNFVIQKNDKELFYDGVEFVALNKSQIYTDARIVSFVKNMLVLKDKIKDVRIVQL